MSSKNERTEGCGRDRSFKNIWQVFDLREAHTDRDFNFLISKKRHMDQQVRLWWLFFSSPDFPETILAWSFFCAFSVPSSVCIPPGHQPPQRWGAPAPFLSWPLPCGQPAHCGDPGDSSALVKMASLLPRYMLACSSFVQIIPKCPATSSSVWLTVCLPQDVVPNKPRF